MIETTLALGRIIISLCVSSLVWISAHQGVTTGPPQLTAKTQIQATRPAKLVNQTSTESTATSETSSTANGTHNDTDTATISSETTHTPLIEEVTATVPAIEATLTPMSPVMFDSTQTVEIPASASTSEPKKPLLPAQATNTAAPAPAGNPAPQPPAPTIQDLAAGAATKYGIPPNLFFALINQESGWNYGAQSGAGALGLTQVMPYNIISEGYGIGTFKNSPALQLDLGAKLLSDQFRTFGRWDLALAAYNAGPGAVLRYNGVPPYRETINYVRSILAMAGM